MCRPFFSYIALAFAGVLTTMSCDKEDENNCLSFGEGTPVAVSAADSATVGQDFPMSVDFTVNSGCGQFGSFEQSWGITEVNVKVIAKYSGCLCTTNLPMRTAEYIFKPVKPGTYYINFIGGGSTVRDTVVVR